MGEMMQAKDIPGAVEALKATRDTILKTEEKYRSEGDDSWLLAFDVAFPIISAKQAEIERLQEENERIRTLRVDLKPEGQRTKPEEWEACYAALFNQLNPVNEENVQLKRERERLRGLLGEVRGNLHTARTWVLGSLLAEGYDNPESLDLLMGWQETIDRLTQALGEEGQAPESPDIDAFLIRLGMPHVKTAFRGDDNPADEQVALEIGKSLMRIHLGLAEEIADVD